MKIMFTVGMMLMAGNSIAQQFYNATQWNLPMVAKEANNSMDAAVADVDGDGDSDIIVGVEFKKNVILINDGKGRFSDGSSRIPDLDDNASPDKPYPYYPYHDTEDVAVADFDRDGDQDIIFVTEDDQINEYYLNNGTGFFKNATSQLPATGVSNAVIAADFDGDGYTDVMIGNRGQNTYLRNSNGRFVNETSDRMPAIDDITQDLEAFDFDKDGDLDVIVGNEKNNVLLLNDGSGHFKDVTADFIDPELQVSGETREADFADINNDGKVDLYFANVFMFQQMAPVQRMLVNKGNGFVDETAERIGFTDSKSCIDADFADLNADGFVDLVLVTYEGPVILKNDGKGFFADITLETIGTIEGMGVDAEVADFNMDGKPDLYFANFRSADMLFLQK